MAVVAAQTQALQDWREDIAEQVEEKKRINQWNKDFDDAYASECLERDRIATYVDATVKQNRFKTAQEVEQFRQKQQGRTTGDAWDLNDPQRLRKDRPARCGDDDPRLGKSCLQKFEGEDLSRPQRAQQQAKQMRNWCQQMVDDKDMRKWNEREANRLFSERQEDATHRAWQQERALAQKRTDIAKDTAAFNRAMADQKQNEKYRSKYREMVANMEEIQNALDSDLLTETAAATVNVNDTGRYKPDHMKGFSPEQQQGILNEQAAQREERKMMAASAKADEQRHAAYQEQQRRAAILLERARARDQRAARQHLAGVRVQQMEEAEYKKQLLNEMYRNDITEDFFSKFGATRR